MKIGIMGGTFDPIHIGHLLLGEFAYEDFGLDEIWFLPNGNPPHKETADTGTSLEHRIEMIRKAIEGVPHFRLNLHEANTEEHSYTYQTMQEFNQMFPEHEFYFILGADSLFSIEQWKYFRELFPTCTSGNFFDSYPGSCFQRSGSAVYGSGFCRGIYQDKPSL